MDNNTTSHKETYFLLGLIFFLVCWLRFPSISGHMPYFAHEDEAHHFNRTVMMVQSGDWNPHYFHKPSLHFYLRAPIVAASFLSEVRRGNIRKIEEIKTRDPYGLAGYAMTASHPAIVKWNRAFSLFLSALTLLLAFLITFELSGSLIIGTIAALIGCLSPALFLHSAVIGVDVPMSFLCMLSVYLGLLLRRIPTRTMLFSCALAAGLAISTKYNALPIAAVPFAAMYFRNGAAPISDVIIVTLSIVAGFLIGSPYILAEFPLFLNQFAYEIWHYGIAGHEGHTAEPGLNQALFYIKWMAGDGLGILATALIPFGIFFSFLKRKPETVYLLTFPLLFFILMTMQRANFTRNMIVVIPFAGIFVALAFEYISDKLATKKDTITLFVPGILFCIVAAVPAYQSFLLRGQNHKTNDSRTTAMHWIDTHNASGDTAIAGEIGFLQKFAESGTRSRLALSGKNARDIALLGFNRVIAGNLKEPLANTETYFTTTKVFPGNAERQRVPLDPRVDVYDIRDDYYQSDPLPGIPDIYVTEGLQTACGNDSETLRKTEEGHCWLTYKQQRLHIIKETKVPGFIAITVMSPWEDQKLSFFINDKREEFELQAGQWQRIVLNLSAKELGEEFITIPTLVSKIHAPSDYSASKDSRRLGVAIKEIALQ